MYNMGKIHKADFEALAMTVFHLHLDMLFMRILGNELSK